MLFSLQNVSLLQTSLTANDNFLMKFTVVVQLNCTYTEYIVSQYEDTIQILYRQQIIYNGEC